MYGRYLVQREDIETLTQLLETGWLSRDVLRSCLDYAIAHTQKGGSPEPQMLIMRYMQSDTPETRFRL